MRQVQLEEIEDHFADLISEAEAGETATIVRAGHPVARIVPFWTELPKPSPEERQAAIGRLDEIMEKGYDLGIVWNGRDELYDRD